MIDSLGCQILQHKMDKMRTGLRGESVFVPKLFSVEDGIRGDATWMCELKRSVFLTDLIGRGKEQAFIPDVLVRGSVLNLLAAADADGCPKRRSIVGGKAKEEERIVFDQIQQVFEHDHALTQRKRTKQERMVAQASRQDESLQHILSKQEIAGRLLGSQVLRAFALRVHQFG